ncbi:MAG: TPM domain-containing protein [Candidatus Limnocylindrales bacterium]
MRGLWRLALGALTSALLAASVALAVGAAPAAGAPPDPSPGPPFRELMEGRMFYDTATVFPSDARRAQNQTFLQLAEAGRLQLFMVTQVKPGADIAIAHGDAEALLAQWGFNGSDVRAVALVWDFTADKSSAVIGAASSAGFGVLGFDSDAVQELVDSSTGEDVASGNWLGALTNATVTISLAAPGGPVAPTAKPTATPAPGSTPAPTTPPQIGAAPEAGPPFPEPIDGVTVYDYADVLEPATEAEAQRIILGIEQRTAAEVVVYTQVKPESDTPAEAERDAIALIDQWGVGRKGFDDGLAILFDMDDSLCHGQVQLYAGPGYRAAFLDNDERQAVFDDQMVPLLRRCEIDQALLVALAAVDANATPEHAAKLQTARQIDAFLGIILAPLLFLLLVGWAASSWWRFGKDPVYLDDPSILMPAPPPELTPAAGALVFDGSSSRHALTTAMLDLASHGELAFKQHEGLIGHKVGVQLTMPDENDPNMVRNRRRPLGPAEEYALERLQAIGRTKPDEYIEPDDLLKFGTSVDTFDARLEDHTAKRGWFVEAPRKSIERWSVRAALEIIGGVVLAIFSFNLPSGGGLVLGIAILAAGVATALIARAMPARTMAGAMLFAMLAAYKRTLHKTMDQARSMEEVVREARLPWLETPDQAAVWGVALGLSKEVEAVLERSLEDLQAGTATGGNIWLPMWYGTYGTTGGGGGFGGFAPGLMSSSAIPDFGGMMSALGTIGNSPASSGSSSSGSSGGFSGGGSGGGGGGSGGGF